MKIIILSGTPGTGKTKISNSISKMIGAEVISLNSLAVSENLTVGYDEKRETSIIDAKRLIKRVKTLIKTYKSREIDFLIIESHFSDIIPSRFINYAIVLRCEPEELQKRLEIRGYNKQKVIENVQSEILGSSTNYLTNKNLKIPILEIDTTTKEVEEVASIIKDLITEKLDPEKYILGKIDWLEKLNLENRLMDYFK